MKIAIFYAFLSSLVASHARSEDERVKVSPIVHYKGIAHLRGTSSFESTIGVDKKGFITLPEISQSSKSIEIQFFDDEEAHMFDNVKSWDTRYGFTWHGKDEENRSSLIISVQINGENQRTYSGSASFGGEVYNFESLPDGKIQVVETNFMSFPSETYESKYEEPVQLKVDTHNEERRLEGGSSVVDVMCLYTPQALCAVNGQRRGCNLNNTEFINRMNGKCELAIDETNVAFQESGIHASANLVYSGFISEDYEEEEYMCDALNMFRSSNAAAYRAVRELREQYAADLVTVIANDVIIDHNGEGDRQICGCGDMFNSHSMAAFSVVHNQCATGYYSTAHELGHNLGCSHEPSSQSTDAGYGYRDPDSKFRTIMAYNCPGGCERVLRFSNKSLQYEGRPMGSNNRSCANEINKNIAQVANFRTREEELNTANNSESHLTENVSNQLTVSPTPSPVAMECTGWNEVKLEIDITAAMNENPKHIKWTLNDTKTNNKVKSEKMEHMGATYTTRICIGSGSTYIIDIEGFSSIESYSIRVEGDIESSGVGDSDGSKSIEIDVDSVDAQYDGKSCTWLQHLKSKKQEKKCSRAEDLQSICPKTCKAALQE